MNLTITDINAVLGLVFGVAGLAVAIFTYIRDRPRIVVSLQWGMKVAGDPTRVNEEIGVVKVTNIGRRPIYLSHVSIKFPKHFQWPYLTLQEALKGTRLEEGDPPAFFTINHSELTEKYKEDLLKNPDVWKKIVAVVWDSAGTAYKSDKVKSEPSWSSNLKSNRRM